MQVLKLMMMIMVGLIVMGGLGYYYVYEVARVCDIEQAESVLRVSCDCRGIEVETKNTLEVDGSRETVCLGVVEKTSCYEYRLGRELEVSCGGT